MHNLKMDEFGTIVCTKIASKLLNGLDHNNSLKPLLEKYLGVKIDKSQQLSDWSKSELSSEHIEYAINDVQYLYPLWKKLEDQLEKRQLKNLAYECYKFVPYYKSLTDKGITNIFIY